MTPQMLMALVDLHLSIHTQVQHCLSHVFLLEQAVFRVQQMTRGYSSENPVLLYCPALSPFPSVVASPHALGINGCAAGRGAFLRDLQCLVRARRVSTREPESGARIRSGIPTMGRTGGDTVGPITLRIGHDVLTLVDTVNGYSGRLATKS